MLRRRGELPIASGGKSRTPPRQQLNMPDPTVSSMLSFLWLLLGLLLIGGGYLHCSRHREESRLHCVEDVCTFSRDWTRGRSVEEYQFLRESLTTATVGYLDKNGDVIEGKRTSRVSRREKRSMAQTYTVTWRDAESGASTKRSMTQFGLGRRVPKEKVSKIMQYVKKQVDELDVREGRWITGVGIVCYAFGGILIVMRFALAPIFMEPPSRRDLSSRRKLFK
ncbi:unnamed protein product [Ascophyllum nodosum]